MATRKLLQDLDCAGIQLLGSPTIITPTIASFVNANHNHTNAANGGVIFAQSLNMLDDTVADVNTSVHGFCPKAPNDTKKFLCGDGSWARTKLAKLSSVVASSSATVDFTSSIDSTYLNYLLLVNNLRPATDAVDLHLRITTDAGSTWKAGATDYMYVNEDQVPSGGGQNTSSTGAAQIKATQGLDSNHKLGSASDESSSWAFVISNPADSGKKCMIRWDGSFIGSGSSTYPGGIISGMGFYKTAGAINGIRFLMSSGNITEGTFELYGVG